VSASVADPGSRRASDLVSLDGLSMGEREEALRALVDDGWVDHDADPDPMKRRYRSRSHRWTLQYALVLGLRDRRLPEER
jgi:hypothetical protein